MSHKNRYWSYYKLFRDPPGTPEELRCITCKYVAAGGAGIVGLASAYGMSKTFKKNVFIGTGLGFLTLCSLSAVGIALRMAHTDSQYNEMLTRERYKKLRTERQANRDQLNHNVA